MKKTLLCLTALLMSATLHAQTIRQVIDKYRFCPKANYSYVSKGAIELIKGGEGSKIDLASLGLTDEERVDSIYLLDLDNCSKKIKRQFAHEKINWEAEGFTPFTNVADTADHAAIYMIPDTDGSYKTIATWIAGKKECGVFLLYGRFDEHTYLLYGM